MVKCNVMGWNFGFAIQSTKSANQQLYYMCPNNNLVGCFMVNHIVNIQSLMWLFLAAFIVHDFEEIIFVESWMRNNFIRVKSRLPKKFGGLLAEFSTITSSQFAIAVWIEFIFLTAATFLAVDYQNYIFFVGCNAVLLLHVLTHLGQSIYLRMYTPGVVSAVLVTFPFSIYLLYRLIHEGYVSSIEVIMYLPFGLILLPIVWWGHKIGKKMIA
jgi:hypothetical protein